MIDVGAFGFGYVSSVALASASLAAMKAEVASLDHCSLALPLLVARSTLGSGRKMCAALSKKQ